MNTSKNNQNLSPETPPLLSKKTKISLSYLAIGVMILSIWLTVLQLLPLHGDARLWLTATGGFTVSFTVANRISRLKRLGL